MNTIVHLGVGNFHRAHQAWYTARAGGDWRILGVSLRSAAVRDALAEDGFDYTLVTRGVDVVEREVISVIDDIIVAPDDRQRVIDAIADPGTHVVTITVTEKGYALGPNGKLDWQDPDVAHDLQGGPPRSLIGFLARAFQLRHAYDAGSLTIMSCDNLTDNGHRLGDAVREFVAVAMPELLDWIATTVRFPNSMVDRITPSTSDALKCEVAHEGLPAAAPVETETFSEWVIEDNFAGLRPDWESVGARLVEDVSGYERRKLRLLNGSHSLVAYLGSLCGHDYVHEAIANPFVRQHVDGFMDEAASTLDGDAARDIDDYRRRLVERFANPSLQHRLEQIAMDGTLKLPLRVFPVIAARDAAGHDAPHARNAAASWVVYVLLRTRQGQLIDDPQAQRIGAAAVASDPVRSLLELLSTNGDSTAADDVRLLQIARELSARFD